MISRQVISTAVAPVHKEESFASEMVTQGLMCETISILGQKDCWCNVRMEDKYEGWIQNFYLSETQLHYKNRLTLTNRYTPLRCQSERDKQIIALLSFGTVVPIIEKTSGYYKIQMLNGKEGFIPPQKQLSQQNRNIIIKLAKMLIGVPYLWGGKSSFGYDCSGFVQMVLKAVGISVFRDATQQVSTKNMKKISIEKAETGDMLFFSENGIINHVAFIVGEGKIIHCSGEVKLESIIKGELGFNSKLAQMDHTCISIAKKVK